MEKIKMMKSIKFKITPSLIHTKTQWAAHFIQSPFETKMWQHKEKKKQKRSNKYTDSRSHLYTLMNTHIQTLTHSLLFTAKQ